MERLAVVWDTLYGLLVDDGWIAGGTLAAFITASLWAFLARDHPSLRDLAGPLLAVLLMTLLLVNLYVAGHNAARKRIEASPQPPGERAR